MAGPAVIRIRRPIVLTGPPSTHPHAEVGRPAVDDTAAVGVLSRPVLLGACGVNVATTQRPIPVSAARNFDAPALMVPYTHRERTTRAWGPLPRAVTANVLVGNDGVLVQDYADPKSKPGRTISPAHDPRPITQVTVLPQSPPPPDMAATVTQGARRLPGLTGQRIVQQPSYPVDAVWSVVQPDMLKVGWERRPARPLQQVQAGQPEFVSADPLPGVGRGVRFRPLPASSSSVISCSADTDTVACGNGVLPQVLVQQVVRPWVPLPRMPIGTPQEQPVDTDVGPQVDSGRRVRWPDRPLPAPAVLSQEFVGEFVASPVGPSIRGRVARPIPPRGWTAWTEDFTAEGPAPSVQIRQVARPWVPLPRMPLGTPQEQPVDTDVEPRGLRAGLTRRPDRPIQSVKLPAHEDVPAGGVSPWVWTPRGGPKVPPLTRTVTAENWNDTAATSYLPARVYSTFGVHSVIPNAPGRTISLVFEDTTAKGFWSFDSTALSLVFTDATAKSLASEG